MEKKNDFYCTLASLSGMGRDAKVVEISSTPPLVQWSENNQLMARLEHLLKKKDKVGSQKIFNITLQEDAQALGEVVITAGYGDIKRKRLHRFSW